MKCPECWKPKNLCLCEDLDPVASRLRVLVLQHPQEARNPRSTARLVSLVLPNAVHRVGLSWKSLATALGAVATPSEWGILYVGQAKEAERLPKNESVHVLSKKKRLRDLKGIVVLDGNWKQSKTLWWRNPWMLRLHRMILTLPEKNLALFRASPERVASVRSRRFQRFLRLTATNRPLLGNWIRPSIFLWSASRRRAVYPLRSC